MIFLLKISLVLTAAAILHSPAWAAWEFSHDSASCSAEQAAGAPHELQRFAAQTTHLLPSATDCPSDDVLFLDKAKDEFKAAFPNLPRDNSQITVEGVTLRGPAVLLEHSKNILGTKPPSSLKTVPASCGTPAEVLCAMRKVFKSEESALRALTIAQKTGYLISVSQQLHPAGVEQIWQPREVRNVDETLKILPPNFYRLSSLKNLFRLADGYHLPGNPNAAAVANPGDRNIVFHDSTFLSGDKTIRSNTIHEVAHHFDFSSQNYSMNGRNAFGWDTLSGWTEVSTGRPGSQTEWTYAPDAQFARTPNLVNENYGATNPLEDFAVHTELYVMDSERMQREAPKKYARLQARVFNGQEFKKQDPWPSLTQLFKATGGDQILLNECIPEISHIGIKSTSAATALTRKSNVYVWIADSNEAQTNSIAFIGWEPKSFAKNTQCLTPWIDNALTTLAAGDPDFCLKGGRTAIAEEVLARFNALFVPLTTAIIEYQLKLNDRTAAPCTAAVSSCIYDQILAPTLDQHPSLRAIPKNEIIPRIQQLLKKF